MHIILIVTELSCSETLTFLEVSDSTPVSSKLINCVKAVKPRVYFENKLQTSLAIMTSEA